MANGADGRIVIDTELDNDGFKQGSDKLLSSVENLARQVNILGVEMKQSFSGIASILQTLSASAQQSASGVNQGAQQATQAAQQTAAAQATATQATGRATQAVSSYDKELAKLQKQIDGAKGKLAEYYQAVEQIKQSTDQSLMDTTTDDQAARILEIEQIQLEQVNQKYAAKIAALEALEAEYARVAAARDAANQPQQEPQKDTSQSAQESAQGIRDVSQAEQEAAQSSRQLGGSLQDVDRELQQKPGDAGAAKGAFSGLRTAMSAVGNAAVNAGKCLGRMAFNTISAGAKRAITSLKSFSSQTQKTALTSNGLVKSLTSVKRLLITRIKRMFISAIFSDVKEGIQQLALFDSAFNRKMSNIKNSATQLSGNISVTVGNIISAIEPVITQVINLISQAVSYLNQFFALLNGKKTYTAAKKGTQNYADAANGAAKAQKEFNAELYGYDELTRQSKKDNDNSSGSGANASQIQYEDIPINLPEGVMNWVDRLKEAFKKQDWYGLGQVIAEGLNTAVQIVDDWINHTLRPEGVKWAGNVAEILNGLTDGVDWPLLGKTVADGLDTIADIYNTFMYTYNWHDLGDKLGEAMNSLVDNIEWDNIGKAFAAKWQALVQFIHGLVHKVEWATLGANIGKAIYSWFSSIDWGKLADSVVTGFNGLVTALRNAINAINWGQVGTTLANGLQTLIMGINWQELGRLLSDAILALLKLALNLITNIDWYAVGNSIMQGIINMLAEIDWPQILAVLNSCIISLLSGAVNLLLGLTGGLSQKLADAFKRVGLDSIAGFFQGIADAMKTIATWIKEYIVDPVVNAVKDFFGIHSPSTVFAEIGRDLIRGLLIGIAEIWNTVTDFFKNALSGLKNLFSSAWESIKSVTVTAWNSIRNGICTAFTNARTTVVDTAVNLNNNLNAAWTTIKNNAQTAWANVKAAISNGFSSARTTVINTATNLNTNLNAAWTAIRNNAQSAWSNLNNTTISMFSTLRNNVLSAWNNMRTSLGNIQWNVIGHNLVVGLNNGIVSRWNTLMSTVTSMANCVIRILSSIFRIHSPSKVTEQFGEFLDAGLENGLEGGKQGLMATVGEIAHAVNEGMTPDTPDVEMTADGVVGSMQAVISGLSSIASTFQTIADALTAVGGFTVPQIAAGTVTPYQTRVAASAPSENDSEGVTGYLYGILSELQALSRSMRNGENGQNSDIRISINGQELFNVVVDENNRAIRRNGASPLRM